MILIVDDDRSVTASLALLLKQAGLPSTAAGSPDEALDVLRRQPCQLIIQDMNFSRRTSGEEGLALLRHIKDATPSIPVILITAWGSIGLAVEGMKAGASDFVTKPWTNGQMLQTVRTALGLAATRAQPDERALTRDELDARYDFGDLAGRDPRMLRILQLIGRVAPTDASVLITGESGTGKELVAEAVHRNSRRAGKPFVKVNLGGVPATLFESEMFGHVRGAFTDARADRKGRFETANGGTIFLDEIGDLDQPSQVKMLRVLQDRTFEVLGSSQRREVDVRVVTATNRGLADMVSRGEFREDLLYRINLLTIHLPPLRERRDDLPALVEFFLNKHRYIPGSPPARITEGAMRALLDHSWPGNVRELENTIRRATVLAQGGVITEELISFSAADERQLLDISQRLREGASWQAILHETERAVLNEALAQHNGDRVRAAQALDLTLDDFLQRLSAYGLTNSLVAVG